MLTIRSMIRINREPRSVVPDAIRGTSKRQDKFPASIFIARFVSVCGFPTKKFDQNSSCDLVMVLVCGRTIVPDMHNEESTNKYVRKGSGLSGESLYNNLGSFKGLKVFVVRSKGSRIPRRPSWERISLKITTFISVRISLCAPNVTF